MSHQLDPGHIMRTSTAFWASKVLLTAVELDLFTVLAEPKRPWHRDRPDPSNGPGTLKK